VRSHKEYLVKSIARAPASVLVAAIALVAGLQGCRDDLTRPITGARASADPDPGSTNTVTIDADRGTAAVVRAERS
jgi:hypothetical protein